MYGMAARNRKRKSEHELAEEEGVETPPSSSRTPKRATRSSGASDVRKTITHVDRCDNLLQQGLEAIDNDFRPFFESCKDSDDIDRAIRLSFEIHCVTKQIRNLYGPPLGHKIWLCGSNDCYQLGYENGTEGEGGFRSNDKLIPFQYLTRHVITHVSAGGLHSAAVSVGGQVFTWGSGDDGQLGREIGDGSQILLQCIPRAVTGFRTSRHSMNTQQAPTEANSILNVACGDTHTIYQTISGNVFVNGCYKNDGKSWRDPFPPDQRDSSDCSVRGVHNTPIHALLPNQAQVIAAGDSMSAAILMDGSLYTWGMDFTGELGRGISQDDREGMFSITGQGDDARKVENTEFVESRFLTPKAVTLPKQLSNYLCATHVACGSCHMLVCTAANVGRQVYSTGLNNYGQLGLGNTENTNELTLIEALSGSDIVQVAAGTHHSLFLGITGYEVFACGRNDSGQLGICDKKPEPGDFESTPQRVHFDRTGRPVCISKVAAGNAFSFAITEVDEDEGSDEDEESCLGTEKTRHYYAWGFGEEGCLGLGRVHDEYRPAKMIVSHEQIGEILDIAGGGQHTVVLASKQYDNRHSNEKHAAG